MKGMRADAHAFLVGGFDPFGDELPRSGLRAEVWVSELAHGTGDGDHVVGRVRLQCAQRLLDSAGKDGRQDIEERLGVALA